MIAFGDSSLPLAVRGGAGVGDAPLLSVKRWRRLSETESRAEDARLDNCLDEGRLAFWSSDDLRSSPKRALPVRGVAPLLSRATAVAPPLLEKPWPLDGEEERSAGTSPLPRRPPLSSEGGGRRGEGGSGEFDGGEGGGDMSTCNMIFSRVSPCEPAPMLARAALEPGSEGASSERGEGAMGEGACEDCSGGECGGVAALDGSLEPSFEPHSGDAMPCQSPPPQPPPSRARGALPAVGAPSTRTAVSSSRPAGGSTTDILPAPAGSLLLDSCNELSRGDTCPRMAENEAGGERPLPVLGVTPRTGRGSEYERLSSRKVV